VPGHRTGFFAWIHSLGVRRGENRWLGGVSSGLAAKWDIDPVIVRGLFVVTSPFFGAGVLLYGLGWAFLPEPDGRSHAEEAVHGHWSAGATGAAILTFLGLLGSGRGAVFHGGLDGGFPWPLIWVAGIIALIYWAVAGRNRRGWASRITVPGTPGGAPGAWGPGTAPGGTWGPATGTSGAAPGGTPPSTAQPYTQGSYAHTGDLPYAQPGQHTYSPPAAGQPPYPPAGAYRTDQPRPPRPRTPRPGPGTVAITVGIAILAGALVMLLASAGLLPLGGYAAATAWATAGIVMGLGIACCGLLGRSSGGQGFLAVLALLVAGALSVGPVGGHWMMLRQDTWAPTTTAAAAAGANILAADATVDLTGLSGSAPLASELDIPLNVAAANLTITVPANIPVSVTVHSAAADVAFNGGTDTAQRGVAGSVTRTFNQDSPGRPVVVNVSAAAGSVNIVSASHSTVRSTP
jgi:phage shock protein PspC (stress-responsive transcriptional regulator)